jgi:AraC family transcriptional regulator of adaptative response / DNA-3-methyladenine glycosylase II
MATHRALSMRLAYRPPYDWEAMLAFLAARAVEGVELVENGRYVRTLSLEGAAGSVEVAPGRDCLRATIRVEHPRARLAVPGRLRRLFDLDADVAAIGAHLERDAALAPCIARRPGLRVPGAWDGFELAVRAVLGQQVSVAAARRLAGTLAAVAGGRVASAVTGHERLTRTFPTPAQVAAADLPALRMPRARVRALEALARAALADERLLEPAGAPDAARERLRAVPGVGAWTAEYWALRALRDGDAFPAGDVGLRRSPAVANGAPLSPRALLARAEAWRPWRAYAAQHLWTADADRRRTRGGTGRSAEGR